MKHAIRSQVHNYPPANLAPSVVTIGTFDGVHRGHQALVNGAISAGRRLGLPVVVWTFDPPPKVFFGRAPMLMCAEEKIERLSSLGVDHVILSRFDDAFRAQSAESFLDLLGTMAPAELWIGDDFRFGARQSGDIAMISERFNVQTLNPVLCRKGLRISSTRIRTHWEKGEFYRIRELVGWEDYYVPPAWDTGW